MRARSRVRDMKMEAYVLLSFIFFARRDDLVQPGRCQGAQPTVACLIKKLNAES
jgi:hypothetical protein